MQLTDQNFTTHRNFAWTEPPAECWPTEPERLAPRIYLIISEAGAASAFLRTDWFGESRMPITAAPDELAKRILRDEIEAMRTELQQPASPQSALIHPNSRSLATGMSSLVSLVPEGPAARALHPAIDRWYLVVFGMQQLINPKFDDHLESIMPNLLYARDRVADPEWMARVRLQTLAAGLKKHVEIERSNRT